MSKRKQPPMTNEQLVTLASKGLDLFRENKMLTMVATVGGLEIGRRFLKARNNEPYEAFITMLQGLSATGYIGSEIEGDLGQAGVISSMLLATGGLAALQATDHGKGGPPAQTLRDVDQEAPFWFQPWRHFVPEEAKTAADIYVGDFYPSEVPEEIEVAVDVLNPAKEILDTPDIPEELEISIDFLNPFPF